MATVIITAAAGGIGRAVAEAFTEAGYDLALNDVDAGSLETLGKTLEHRTRVTLAAGDISDPEVRARLLQGAREQFGELRVLVNNAGIALPESFPRAPRSAWRRLMEINLIAPMELTQDVHPDLRSRGGAVVNVASTRGIALAEYSDPDYAATKAALIRLSAALGQVQDQPSVRVNAILPDWVHTAAVEKTRANTTPERWAQIAPERLVEPEEIGRVHDRSVVLPRTARRRASARRSRDLAATRR